MKFLITMMLFGTSVFAQNVTDGNGAGNGGDPLRKLFQQAQIVAADLSQDILPCEFQSNVKPSVREWVLKNQAMLAHDILQTQQKWIVDLQGTCAYTSLNLGANVYLSYNECRESTHSLDDAVFTLIHESVHHFGITEEGFADEVAHAIMEASDLTACSGSGTPFDDDYCSGNPITQDYVLSLFQPGTVDAAFKTLNSKVYMRRCQTLTGCQSWREDGVVKSFGGSHILSVFKTNFYIIGNVIEFNMYEYVNPYTLYSYRTRDWTPEVRFNSSYGVMVEYNKNNLQYLNTMVGKITTQCTRLASSGRFEIGGGITEEYKVVFYSRY